MYDFMSIINILVKYQVRLKSLSQQFIRPLDSQRKMQRKLIKDNF